MVRHIFKEASGDVEDTGMLDVTVTLMIDASSTIELALLDCNAISSKPRTSQHKV
jgi:hypothetical protein